MHVIEQINRGGFGVVEKVQLNDGSIVARKTFDPSIPLTTDEEREKVLKRFIREVKIQSSFKSESICPILDSDLTGDAPWFTMPLAEKTLADELTECAATGNVPSQALADVLNALEALHELDYVHRDLKPQNVLLVDGVWKLTDFGLILPPTGSTTKLTSVGSSWGTPAYAAPEQSAEFRALGSAADIYAFGCILHDIFGDPPRVPYAKQSASGAIGGIIERCTEINPTKRFVSVVALRGALLSQLSKPENLNPSSTMSDWVDAVKEGAIHNSDKLEELVRYIKMTADPDDRHVFFYGLDEAAIAQMHTIDSDLWKPLALDYCEWVASVGFDFSYCDVLIHRLTTIFELGDVETRTAAALSAAELGSSHNRFYVMSRVLRMCGAELDEKVAERLCIDIRAFEYQDNFRRCAGVIAENRERYHPKIVEILADESQ